MITNNNNIWHIDSCHNNTIVNTKISIIAHNVNNVDGIEAIFLCMAGN